MKYMTPEYPNAPIARHDNQVEWKYKWALWKWGLLNGYYVKIFNGSVQVVKAGSGGTITVLSTFPYDSRMGTLTHEVEEVANGNIVRVFGSNQSGVPIVEQSDC